MKFRAVVLAGFVPLLIAGASPPASAPTTEPTTVVTESGKLVNERCPVMPEELAKSVHEITFRGVLVRFCCQQCKGKFVKNPEPYLAQLPHVPPTPRPADSAAGGGILSRLLFSDTVFRIGEKTARWRGVLIVVLITLVAHLISIRWIRARAAAADDVAKTSRRNPIAGAARVLARRTTVVALVTGMCLVRWLGPQEENVLPSPGSTDSSMHDQAGLFQAHLARQGIMQGPEFVAKMDKIYYRGNDDRAPTLFNGGIYRTCEFHVSLRTKDGKAVIPGRQIGGEALMIRVEIHRSRNTLESHFLDDAMTQSVLVSRLALPSLPREQDESVYPFTVIESQQRWVAEAPIGLAGAAITHHLNGCVLICPTAPRGSTASNVWSSAHYGIQYSLRIESGVLTPSSKLWMGAIILPLDLPDDQFYEWLDWKPLPEVPDGFRPVNETEQISTQPAAD